MNDFIMGEVDSEINNLNQELHSVISELSKLKKKHEKNLPAKKEAQLFIDKAEKVISLAEQGKIQISPGQKEKIEETLKKILKLFHST